MKAYFQPVRWTPGTGISLDELFAYMKEMANGGREFEYVGINRRLFLAEVDGFHVALFLSAREYGHRCKAREGADGRVYIDVTKGVPDDHFNFMVLQASSGIGLYLHYHQSCAFTKFTSLARLRYEALREQVRQRRAVQLGDNEKAMNKARREIKGNLRGDRLIRREALDKLIEKFKRIKAIQLTAVELGASEEFITPAIENAVDHVNHRFVMSLTAPNDLIRAATASIVDNYNARRGKIFGELQNGDEDDVRLDGAIDSFGELERDEVAEHMLARDDELASCWPVAQMIDVIKLHPTYFSGTIAG